MFADRQKQRGAAEGDSQFTGGFSVLVCVADSLV